MATTTLLLRYCNRHFSNVPNVSVSDLIESFLVYHRTKRPSYRYKFILMIILICVSVMVPAVDKRSIVVVGNRPPDLLIRKRLVLS